MQIRLRCCKQGGVGGDSAVFLSPGRKVSVTVFKEGGKKATRGTTPFSFLRPVVFAPSPLSGDF
jgi:hypothetical protein